MSYAALYALGNFTIDDIVLWPSGQTWMNQSGGNVLFAALGARIWLDQVGVLARLGSDYPREKLQEIAARGIRLCLHEVEAPTLHDWALYEANGGRQFINHLNSGSNEAMTLRADEIPAEHLQGRAYHLAPVPIHQQAALVARLKRPGCLISLDPHEAWIGGNEATLQAMLADVDFFLPSEIEAIRLFGRHAPEAAAQEFARYGPKGVVIKLGAEGSLVYDARRDRLTHVPIYPAQVRDTTGAGDAYCGGFLAGYLLTGDPIMAALHGTVSASYVVEAIGALATRQPPLAEARARLTFLIEKIAPILTVSEYGQEKNGLQ
jgi:ribokinase